MLDLKHAFYRRFFAIEIERKQLAIRSSIKNSVERKTEAYVKEHFMDGLPYSGCHSISHLLPICRSTVFFNGN